MEQKTNIDQKISMISAASRVLSFIEKNPLAIPEEVFQDVADFIAHSGNDDKTKLLMVAAATRAGKIFKDSRPRMTSKQILKQIMSELNSIITEVDHEILN